ncbi:F0F1 ATP synthase subunit delta [Clostridium chromiireducens]|uniref:F0F1 ATP synthase subunit delta n=1 Tax=Clostridium chromiireducens TaxID=225345 RepID=UPI003AF87735
MYEYLDRRYALALYEIAERNNKVDEYIQDLKEVCDLIENNTDFYEIVKHPEINTTKKKQLFTDLFKGKIDDELLSFMLVLIEKNRILDLRGKLNQLINIDLERKNILRGVVKTAVPILQEELEKLTVIFEKKYEKKILFETEIDKSVLGGVYLRIGNDVIDGTVRSKIQEMKDLMLKKE